MIRFRKAAAIYAIGIAALMPSTPVALAQSAQTTAMQTSTSASPAEAPKTFKREELAALLAPIALYADTLIAQILMATTYPLEVVEANRWVQANKNLKGDELAKKAQEQGWDPSVAGLCAVPEVLKNMDEKLDWMQKVGDAVLSQQKEVLDVIQELRRKAKDAGNLKSDDHMKVTTEAAPAPAPAAAGATATATASSTSPQVIVIESSKPDTVYVPTYTTAVYGTWAYPAYPPYYYPPPYGYAYAGAGFFWGAAVGFTMGAIWGGAWGGGCGWGGGEININRNTNINGGDRNFNGGNRNQVNGQGRGQGQGQRGQGGRQGGGQSWSHNPEHRKGASYRDGATANKFGQGTNSRTAQSRDSFRGRTSGGDMGSFKGGGNQSNLGSRGGADAGSRGSSSRGGASAGATSRGGGSAGGGSRGGSSSMGGGGGSRGGSSSFGGMSSGSRSSSFSSRGGSSRSGGGGGSRGGGGGRRR